MSNLKPYRVGPHPHSRDGFRATYPDGYRVKEGDIVYIDPRQTPDSDGEVRFRRDSNEETRFSWIMARDVTPVENEEVITIKVSDVAGRLAPWERELLDGDNPQEMAWGKVLEAVAEWIKIKETPPVDEAQVEAFAAIIRERYDETGSVTRYPTEHSLARRLVEKGARIKVTP